VTVWWPAWPGTLTGDPGKQVWSLELTGPSDSPSTASSREGDTIRRVDLVEWLQDTTRDLAKEVTLERICNTISIGEGALAGLIFCRAVTKLSVS